MQMFNPEIYRSVGLLKTSTDLQVNLIRFFISVVNSVEINETITMNLMVCVYVRAFWEATLDSSLIFFHYCGFVVTLR